MRKINNAQGAYTESLIEGIGELATTLTQSLSITADERDLPLILPHLVWILLANSFCKTEEIQVSM